MKSFSHAAKLVESDQNVLLSLDSSFLFSSAVILMFFNTKKDVPIIKVAVYGTSLHLPLFIPFSWVCRVVWKRKK